MSQRAWVYIWSVLLTGIALSGLTLPGLVLPVDQWTAFTVLVVLATAAQILKAQAPNHQWYHTNLVFFFAGVLILEPFFFVLLVFTAHGIEWLKERWQNSPFLRDWYLQPFNMAVHIIAGILAHHTYQAFSLSVGQVPLTLFAIVMAAAVYVAVNHVLISLALLLARGISLRDSGLLEGENLLTDFIMLCMGAIAAIIWNIDPWTTLLAFSPLALIYRALMIPQLKQEARIDGKTGLWNARHFLELYSNEMERAKRFERPLALIMADLDLLRNINNTYGHLAGDAVLTGIGHIIRENLRTYDIAGRFGGEEFAIVLPETDLTEARVIAERLRQVIECAEFEINTSPTPIKVTMSLGVACFPNDATELEDLIHEADVAVYQAKLQGRNCVICAVDVPEYIKQMEEAPADRLDTPYAAAFTPRPIPKPTTPSQEATVPATEAGPDSANGAVKQPEPAPETLSKPGEESGPSARWETMQRDTQFFVTCVIGAGALVALVGFLQEIHADWVAVGLLAVIAVIAELLQLDLYGKGTVSVSMAIIFAAALIGGIPGVTCVGLGIVLSHAWHRQPPLHQLLFGWAGTILAGAAPVTLMFLLGPPSHTLTIPFIALAGAAALLYYAIDTGIRATHESLEERSRLYVKWHEQYQQLLSHYLVLGFMGLFMDIAYQALGPKGILVLTIPILLIRLSQKYYVKKREEMVQSLYVNNWELSQSNQKLLNTVKSVRQLNQALLTTVGHIIDARLARGAGYAAHVAELATAVALEMNLPSERVERIRQAAFLLDIGLLEQTQASPRPGLQQQAEQTEHTQTHTLQGAAILSQNEHLCHLAPFVRHHHEYWDGQGYPDGLHGKQIPLESRILSVCDTVIHLLYHSAANRLFSVDQVIAHLQQLAGTRFDPAVIEAATTILQREAANVAESSSPAPASPDMNDNPAVGRPCPWSEMPAGPLASGG